MPRITDIFTPYERRVFFGSRLPEELAQIEATLNGMDDAQARDFRKQLWDTRRAQIAIGKHTRRGKSTFGRLLVSLAKRDGK